MNEGTRTFNTNQQNTKEHKMNIAHIFGTKNVLPCGDIYRVRFSLTRWVMGRHPWVSSITDEVGRPTPIRPNTPEYAQKKDGTYPAHDAAHDAARDANAAGM